ncbi:MAG: two-component system sensor kinase FixL [Bacteroidia bacterium]|jgi:two-component system sensor kinase FixL
MYNDKSVLIAELAELYEFSLNIGTSLNASKNATAFFTSFAQRKNIKYISVWYRLKDVLHLKESFPKVHGSDEKIGHDSPLCKHFTILEKGKVHRIDEQNMCFSGFDAQSVWLYYSEDIYILFLQNELDPDFSNREKSQFATLFKKFALSMKACFSHKASLDEVLKRQVSEKNLFELESMYRIGGDTLSEGIIVTDLNETITYANKAMVEITGFTKKEILERVPNELFRPIRFADAIKLSIEKKYKSNISRIYEVQQRRKDGSLYWVRVTRATFKDYKGNEVGSISSMRDITEALTAQLIIETSRKDLQELIDTMYDGLVLMDSTGVIKDANNSALDLFEIDRDTLGKINIEDIVHPDEKATVGVIIKKVMNDGSLLNFVSKIKTHSGKTKHVEVSSYSIWKDGVYIGSRNIVRDITEALAAQLVIETSRKDLQELIDTMYDGLLLMDSTGVIKDANNSALDLFEIDRGTLGQINIEDLVHPDEKATVGVIRKKVKKDGALLNFESKIKTHSGKTKYVEVSSSAIWKDGVYIGSRDIIRDITEKVNAQIEIDLKNAELEDLVENMYDALIVTGINGEIRDVNKAGEQLLGYSKENAVKLDLKTIVHPDDATKSLQYLKKLETDGFYSGYEGRIISGDGSIKDIEVNSNAIIEDGKLVGSRDIVRDITERKELERQHKLSETKLRLIIDTALDAVVTMDAAGNITEWNKNAEHIFGYTHDEVIGKRMRELIMPQRYREAHTKGMKHFLAGGKGVLINNRTEISAIDRNNREFPVELSITPVTQDGTTFFSAFIRDITERKEIEAQKEFLREELESVNQELRDFAYIISHDLKAPLRSIGSLSDWLIQDYTEILDSEGKELLQLLKARIGRMHGLIEGVLQYSKVGRLKDEKEIVDINTVVAETIDLLDPPDNFEVKVDENLPTVSYDRVRLQQVFQNLLSNAIKFKDKPKGLLEVIFKEDDFFYYFSIKDNGPGIEDAYFQKIFKIFQTLRARDNYESTGIGLSIVQRIVELNGGSISVSSEVGVGSTFSFTIPKN